MNMNKIMEYLSKADTSLLAIILTFIIGLICFIYSKRQQIIDVWDDIYNRRKIQEELKDSQKKLSESVSSILKADNVRDTKIQSLIIADRELLADKINQKYKQYVTLQGIPEDEVDEFTNLYHAYKGLGGNHSGDAKYHYVMEHLEVIPVEVKLLFEVGE